MIKYGLISETDARTIEKTIDLILNSFPEILSGGELTLPPSNPIRITEIGLFDCGTVNGIFSYLSTKCAISYIGIDNEKDKPINAPEWITYIKGNSSEVYNQLEDNSQHLIFQDANHSYPSAIQDFFCYMRKVKVGGYMAWHDVAQHSQGKDWQRMGDEKDLDMSISVRKALTDIGLLDNKFEGWEFIMEDADLNNECGGIAIFKKLY